MSEAKEYAKMSEIPVSSCEICVQNKSSKKKDAKSKVISKANKNLQQTKKPKIHLFSKVKSLFTSKFKKSKQQKQTTEKDTKKHGFDVVSAQIIVIFVLM